MGGYEFRILTISYGSSNLMTGHDDHNIIGSCSDLVCSSYNNYTLNLRWVIMNFRD